MLSLTTFSKFHFLETTARELTPLAEFFETIKEDELINLGYIHSTVNHTTTFVDPGVTINHVESFWCKLKRKLTFVFGSQGDMKWSRLDEAVYREYYEFKNKDLRQNFNMPLISSLNEIIVSFVLFLCIFF